MTHKFSIAIQPFTYCTWFSLTFPNLWPSLRVIEYGTSLQLEKKVSALNVYKEWKRQKRLWKILLESEDWSAWFSSYHTADESHTLKDTSPEVLTQVQKVVYEIFRASAVHRLYNGWIPCKSHFLGFDLEALLLVTLHLFYFFSSPSTVNSEIKQRLISAAQHIILSNNLKCVFHYRCVRHSQSWIRFGPIFT